MNLEELDDLALRALPTPSVEAPDALEVLADALVEHRKIDPPRRARRRSGRKYAKREERDRPKRRDELLMTARRWAERRARELFIGIEISGNFASDRLALLFADEILADMTRVIADLSPDTATGEALDRIAATYGIQRLEAPTLSFSLPDRVPLPELPSISLPSISLGVPELPPEPRFAPSLLGEAETDASLRERIQQRLVTPRGSYREEIRSSVASVLRREGASSLTVTVEPRALGPGTFRVRVPGAAQAVLDAVSRELRDTLPEYVYVDVTDEERVA